MPKEAIAALIGGGVDLGRTLLDDEIALASTSWAGTGKAPQSAQA